MTIKKKKMFGNNIYLDSAHHLSIYLYLSIPYLWKKQKLRGRESERNKDKG